MTCASTYRALGADTVETCRAGRISALAFEAGKTLLLEREAVESLARKHKISLAAWSSQMGSGQD